MPTTTIWPAGPLDAAQRAFDLLTYPPTPLVLDGAAYPGLPAEPLTLDRLKPILVADTTPRPVRDTVWRDLVTRARRDGPAWVIAAVGLAMPGLRRAAGRLTTGWHGDTADLDAELLTGFLERLHTLDLDPPRICGRLIDAAARVARRARIEDLGTTPAQIACPSGLSSPRNHPDWVLDDAVAAAVIDRDDHLLISATRLDGRPLTQVAAELGVGAATAAAWRRKAERRLARVLTDSGRVQG